VPVPQITTLPVKALFKTVTQLMRAEMSKRNIQFQMQMNTDDLFIEADSKLIEQVLINLLTNSMHAVAENNTPEIRLLAYQENNKKIIEVADNGAGIAADKLDKIFIPFFSTKEGGSGIGLSLSKHIMSLHKGNIKVNSQAGLQPGQQTSFYLIF
jgi:signal transduction histidine kinase